MSSQHNYITMLNIVKNKEGQTQIHLTRSDAHELIAKLNDMLRKDESVNSFGMPNVVPISEVVVVQNNGNPQMFMVQLQSMLK